MATFWLDPVNGNDANNGTSYALAWATLTSGATAARIAAGDTIRVMKTADAVDLGQQATFVSGVYRADQWKSNSTLAITSSTNASPIVITTIAHTLATGDYVGISGHTTNTAANGVWRITVISGTTFSLTGSTGNGVGGAAGVTYKLSSQMLTLTTPVTAMISDCDSIWTAGSSTVPTVEVNTASKEGIGAAKLTITTPATSTKLAYITIPSTSFASYNQVSLWIKNTVAITAGQYSLSLCSDTAGATPVNTVNIVAIPSVNQWVALTFDTGAALGSAIQSVALYTAGSAGVSNVITLDCIIACGPSGTASSLSLTSLIGKNNGTDGWFCIRSIVGTRVNLDHGVNSAWPTTRGYWGVSETVELWRRETFKCPMMTALGTNTNNILTKSGTGVGAMITYSGGWDSGGVQSGATYWDGQNGFGCGVSGTTSFWNYIAVSNMNFSRFGYAVSPIGGTYTGINYNVFNITNCTTAATMGLVSGTLTINNISFMTGDGFLLNAAVQGTINVTNMFAIALSGFNTQGTFSPAGNTYNVTNLMSIQATGVVLNPSTTLTFTQINSCLNNITAPYVGGSTLNCGLITNPTANGAVGILLSTPNNIVNGGTINGCTSGLQFTGTYGNLAKNMTIASNTNDIVLNSNAANNVVPNSVIGSTFSTVLVNGSVDERLHIRNPGGTTSAACYSDSMTCVTDLTTVHGSGRSWKITTSRTSAAYPATLNLGYVIVQASTTNTVSAWVYYTSAGMTAGITIAGNQIEGMTGAVSATSTGTANTWIQVTATITTATQSGPVMVQAYGLSSSGSQVMYIADISIS